MAISVIAFDRWIFGLWATPKMAPHEPWSSLPVRAASPAKRSLASREFALGIEALERFVACEPSRRIHKCVFGILALESEPVNPRL